MHTLCAFHNPCSQLIMSKFEDPTNAGDVIYPAFVQAIDETFTGQVVEQEKPPAKQARYQTLWHMHVAPCWIMSACVWACFLCLEIRQNSSVGFIPIREAQAFLSFCKTSQEAVVMPRRCLDQVNTVLHWGEILSYDSVVVVHVRKLVNMPNSCVDSYFSNAIITVAVQLMQAIAGSLEALQNETLCKAGIFSSLWLWRYGRCKYMYMYSWSMRIHFMVSEWSQQTWIAFLGHAVSQYTSCLLLLLLLLFFPPSSHSCQAALSVPFLRTLLEMWRSFWLS